MDGASTPKAGSRRKAVLPVPPTGIDAGAGAGTSSARGSRKKAMLPGGAAVAAVVPAAATAAPGAESNGGGGGGEDNEDDEQVERFYALLANIRAMRGGYVSGSGTGALDDGVVDAGGGEARAKRLRGSEPPWRPAFRMEDFEEPTPPPTSASASDAAPCAKRTRGQEEADGEARPDVVARSRS